jgi:hypothetical protein
MSKHVLQPCRIVRRDGVPQRYWIRPSRSHDAAVDQLVNNIFDYAVSGVKSVISPVRPWDEIWDENMEDALVRVYSDSLSRYAQYQSEESVPRPRYGVVRIIDAINEGIPRTDRLFVRVATEVNTPEAIQVMMDELISYMESGLLIIPAITSNVVIPNLAYDIPRILREIIEKSPHEWGKVAAIQAAAQYIPIGIGYYTHNRNRADANRIKASLVKSFNILLDALNGKWVPPLDIAESVLTPLDDINLREVGAAIILNQQLRNRFSAVLKRLFQDLGRPYDMQSHAYKLQALIVRVATGWHIPLS